MTTRTTKPATPTGSSGSSAIPSYADAKGASTSANGMPAAFQYQPKTVNITDLSQTSQPDIVATVNAAMQSLLGRNATATEIAQYGAELLAAEKAYPGGTSTTLNYDPTTAKPLSETGTQLSAGVNPQAFIENLIAGSGQAKDYKIATQYMDAIQQANQEYKGAYNG